MMKRTSLIPAALLLILTACQGPHAKAGAEKDKAAAEVAGRTYSGDGPNERGGAAKDRAAGAAGGAPAAAAGGAEGQGEPNRRPADVQAEQLEQKASAIRKEADARADAFDAQAAVQRK
mgnify:CR=1 FL=1